MSEMLIASVAVAAALALVGVIVFVSARRMRRADARATAAVHDSEAQLSAIVESAMDAIITVDSGHKIVLFNRAAEQVFRCSQGGGARRFARSLPAGALSRRAPRPHRALRPHRGHQPAHGRCHHSGRDPRRRQRGVPDRGLDLADRDRRQALLHRDPARHHRAQAGRGPAQAPAERAARALGAGVRGARGGKDAHRARAARRAGPAADRDEDGPVVAARAPAGARPGARGQGAADERGARPDRRLGAAHRRRPAPADARRPGTGRRRGLAGGGLRAPLGHRVPHRPAARGAARGARARRLDRGLPRAAGGADQHRAPLGREARLGGARGARRCAAARDRGRRARHLAR